MNVYGFDYTGLQHQLTLNKRRKCSISLSVYVPTMMAKLGKRKRPSIWVCPLNPCLDSRL